jgi:hypothetical protein
MAVRDDFTAGEVLAAADLNDTFASKPPFAYGTATPSTTVEGFIFYDENDTPPTPKFWDGSAFQPFSTGVENADFSDAATGTYTDSGIDYKYITYNASGTLTCTVAGLADVLIVGAGAGGGDSQGGGGGGGGVIAQSVFLDVSTYTVTIGGGGAAGTSGNAGAFGTYSALGRNVSIFGGGGGGSTTLRSGRSSAATSGGGSGPNNAINPDLIGTSQGQKGGNGASNVCGGGGGASGVGGNGVASTSSGNGGAGISSSLNNTATGYGGGGGGGSLSGPGGTGTDGGGNGGANTVAGSAGSANRGGGGGGGGNSALGGAGGSGIVIVRVRTN